MLSLEIVTSTCLPVRVLWMNYRIHTKTNLPKVEKTNRNYDVYLILSQITPCCEYNIYDKLLE
jgi:hypothetical protein